MKLRIRGNSLRLRLTRSEVERIGDGEAIEETIHFGAAPHQRLTYRLETSTGAHGIESDFSDNRITVCVPANKAREWATTELISLEDEQPLGATQAGDGNGNGNPASTLKLLIEKDFACLTARRGDDDADTFQHPMEGALRC